MAVDISRDVIGAALTIHRKLGPGLLESAYEACLAYELEKAGFRVEKQKAVPLVYEAVRLECGFRADLVIDGKLVVVEVQGLPASCRRSSITFLPALAEYSDWAADQLSCVAVKGWHQEDGKQLSGGIEPVTAKLAKPSQRAL